jgi:hypothetical protein
MNNDDTKNKQGSHRTDESGAVRSGAVGVGGGIVEKLKQTLANTSVERWEEAGEELDPNKKHQRPRETWDQMFCTDTKNGVLVLRRSVAVTSNFFGGGYTYAESGIPRFFVEIRPRGWVPRMLLDPFYRSHTGSEQKEQVLAEGEVAKQLYREVELTVKQHRDSLRRDFTDSVERLMANIHEQVRGTAAEDWQKEDGEPGFTGYKADVNGMTVTVGCLVKERAANYVMRLSKYGLHWDCRDMNIIRDIFAIVDESVRQASLEQLGKVLEDML